MCFLSSFAESYRMVEKPSAPSSDPSEPEITELSAQPLFPRQVRFVSSVSFFVFLGVTGALTALGDTLFPVTSLTAGFQQDVAANSHFLIKLRGLHPFLAVLWILSVFVWSRKLEVQELLPIRATLLFFVILQFFLGFLNWMLLAPTAMQIVHLLVADLVFISLWWSGLKYEARKGRLSA
jgi:hypothetical protein